MIEIRIDAPGAGEWVMDLSGGSFNPNGDHSFASFRDGKIIGGFVCAGYYGSCWTLHQAGTDPHWCSRELLWMTFDYIFNQTNCYKAVGLVRSDNYRALATNLRGGWVLEAVLRDMFGPGIHMMVLTMTREQCRWLNYEPKNWRSGKGKAA